MLGNEVDAPGAARRVALRLAQTKRLIRLRVGKEEDSLTLINLSSLGAMGQTRMLLEPGQTVALVFECGQIIAGHVRWCRETFAGFAFEAPLPVRLQHPGARLREREPRYRVHREATVSMGNVSSPAIVRNISARGMMIETDMVLCLGQLVQVTCGIGAPSTYEARWMRGRRAGLLLREETAAGCS
jgi:hypothetical protein